MVRNIPPKLMEKIMSMFCEDEDTIAKINEKDDCWEILGSIHYQDVRIKIDKKTFEVLEGYDD